ncbi:MAG: SDR family oxidoreductase, partial [Verrucomicrobia bacterium]|nr:SDR family oxidoreductase [Verrucomicrobiota bacterium]
EFSPEYQDRWPNAEIVGADALDCESLAKTMEGVHTAFYLMQSMFVRQEEDDPVQRQIAGNFRRAAETAGLQRIIFLDRLGEAQDDATPGPGNGTTVAQELAGGKVPTTVLRTAFVIGAGSATYELISHLVKNLRVIPIPRWAKKQCQPISVHDVIEYLVGVLENDATAGKVFDIGGSEVLTYEEMLKTQARLLGRKRYFPPFPISSIRGLAYRASLATPVTAPIILSLMQWAQADVVCKNNDIRSFVPFQPNSFEGALRKAMSREEQDDVHTRWSDEYPLASELPLKLDELRERPRYVCSYSLLTQKDRSSLFRSLCRIGGNEGWFNSNWMWRLRGACDRLLMGVGTARGRRSESELRLHDVIDFWRVEKLETDRILRLRAEMKVPGKAWLEFVLSGEKDGNRLTITAYFQPHGLAGTIYWYAFLPSHHFIFNDIIRQIEKRS